LCITGTLKNWLQWGELVVITILGKRWRLRFCRIKDDGECDAPEKKGKEIRINSRLRGQEKLETLIHELLHAGNWFHRSEEAVTQEARDMARVLWKLNYRERHEEEGQE
jgi:hypothetical protein